MSRPVPPAALLPLAITRLWLSVHLTRMAGRLLRLAAWISPELRGAL